MKNHSPVTGCLTDDETLLVWVKNAGLMKCWQSWPEDVRDAAALAATYTQLLAEDPGADVAPWVFPETKENL